MSKETVTRPVHNKPAPPSIGKSRLRLTCPFCGGFFRIRTSSRLSPITVRALGECQGCTYRGYLSITHDSMAFPSDHPNAGKARVYLPVTDYMVRFVEKGTRKGVQARHDINVI